MTKLWPPLQAKACLADAHKLYSFHSLIYGKNISNSKTFKKGKV